MSHPNRFRRLLLLPVVGLAALLGGCVVYPGEGGYGYRHGGYYQGPAVAFEGGPGGGGGGWGGGWGGGGGGHHHHGW